MGRCGNIAFCAMVLFYCSFFTGDYLCVSSVPHIINRRNGVTDVNLTLSHGSNQTQSSNITEPTPHRNTTTEMLNNSSALAVNVSFSGNISDSRNDSDVSPVKNETTVNTVKPTTLLPSTTHEPKSTVNISTLHPESSGAHNDTPSALNVTDSDNSKASTDPLLAGLVSAFIVVVAIVSVLIFLKFRNKNSGPVFHRLQDLPMDDMLEDAPLTMYSY
ncbi:uncharacterized protein LOC127938596 [Carassius gibelio]|uniref:uncharacterized protein LOC127938596 n=1 Tax=Carassius gibelio TaxID=101364 RepID=UPI0022786EDB|nr:uncharacterized protein LOC127938596 [Carassius gibelio]